MVTEFAPYGSLNDLIKKYQDNPLEEIIRIKRVTISNLPSLLMVDFLLCNYLYMLLVNKNIKV